MVFSAEKTFVDRVRNNRERQRVDNLVISAQALTKNILAPSGQTLNILRGINLFVNSGEAVAILGPSGSGKSTLLGILAGLDTFSDGTVSLFGQDLNSLDEDQKSLLRLGKIGFVFQSFQLMPGMSALENVILPMKLAGKSDFNEKAKKILTDVGLESRLDHLPQQLSGGEQQRVAIARAFACTPRILFADEPTGNLDDENSAQIENLLFQLKSQFNTSLVVVTHENRLANRCDRILRMQGGILS
tara:strand:- start:8755 stop:9489 length:735 start_codon:yes stop_codon:yes gene_type:complete